jgi:hypothetical protein
MSTITVLILAAAALHAADEPAKAKPPTAAERKEMTERICAAAKRAVAAGDLARTEPKAPAGSTPFEELSRSGWVLIGFKVGSSQAGDRTIIQTLEPIYVSARGDVIGAKRGKERNTLAKRMKSSAFVTEALRAKPGYAVGAVKVSASATVEGIKLVYMRIVGEKLDPKDSIESKWVGNYGLGDAKIYGGAGHLIVGFLGAESKTEIQQIGFIFAGKDAPANPDTEEVVRNNRKQEPEEPADELFRDPKGAKKKELLPQRVAKMVKKDDDRKAPSGPLAKEPKTPGIDLTVRQPAWKWDETYKNSRVGDTVQYEFVTERLTRIHEIVEVGDRFIVFRERILPINGQKLVAMKFDQTGGEAPKRPTPENIVVEIHGQRIACRRYVLEAEKAGGVQRQEVYSDEVPFDGLVGRLSDKGNVHLRRFVRGPQ